MARRTRVAFPVPWETPFTGTTFATKVRLMHAVSSRFPALESLRLTTRLFRAFRIIVAVRVSTTPRPVATKMRTRAADGDLTRRRSALFASAVRCDRLRKPTLGGFGLASATAAPSSSATSPAVTPTLTGRGSYRRATSRAPPPSPGSRSLGRRLRFDRVLTRASLDQHQAEHDAQYCEPGTRGESGREALRERVRQLALRAVRRRHHVVRARGCDRRQHREPERSADLLRGVDQPGREPGVLVAHAVHRGDRDGHEREAEPDGGHDRRRQDVGRVAAVDRYPREQQEADRDEGHARDEDRLEAEARYELRGDAGRQDDRDRERQVRKARLQRRVAQHLLHVERHEEEHREERRADQEAGNIRPGDVLEPE